MCAGGVLVGADHAGVGVAMPVQVPGGVRSGLQIRLDAHPGAVFLPAGEPLVQRLPRAIPLRHIPPRYPGTDPKQDPIDHLPVIPPPTTPLRRPVRQQRLDHRVLGVSQLKASRHNTGMPGPEIQKTDPRADSLPVRVTGASRWAATRAIDRMVM